MEQLINKYADKLVSQGICEAGAPLIGGLDAELIWNREALEISVLEKVIAGLNINSILFAEPAEPFRSIINYLAEQATLADGAIHPEDTETRTFLHDIPVCVDFEAAEIIKNLKRRKSVIIPGHGIVTFGIVSPEQAFVTFSSVCFSTYVKLFVDYYFDRKNKGATEEQEQLIFASIRSYQKFMESFDLSPAHVGPFRTSSEVIQAMAEAGRLTVESRMVDSFFGNISYKLDNILFISQTGSSLDELESYIDPCPLDNSTCAAITASSEFIAHKSVLDNTNNLCILHGHPKFSVIISMLCDKKPVCKNRDKCHLICSEPRFVEDIPIIPGEVGTGKYGISTTLPPALTGRGAIVYGHGVFTTGKIDFTDAFQHLKNIEMLCFQQYCLALGNNFLE